MNIKKIIFALAFGISSFTLADNFRDDMNNQYDHDNYTGAGHGGSNSGGGHSQTTTPTTNANITSVKYLKPDGTYGSLPISGIRQHCVSEYGDPKKLGLNPGNINEFEKKLAASKTQTEQCITNFTKMADAQKNMPVLPNAPEFNCSTHSQIEYASCQAKYEQDLAEYKRKLAEHDSYLNANADMYSQNKISASEIMKDIIKKQERTIARLMEIKKYVIMGATAAATKAAVSLTSAIIASFNPVTGPTVAPPLYKTAAVFGGISAGLFIVGKIVQNQHDKQVDSKTDTCEQLNKIVTKKFDCDTAQGQTSGLAGSTFNKTGSLTRGPSNMASPSTVAASFIDPTTGKCRNDAPAECAQIVKSAPAGCFKTGGSCMAALQKQDSLKDLGNGKYQMKINGKDQTVDASTFESEASLMKAGFSAAEAKGIHAGLNGPDGVLAKNGLNAKGELKDFNTPDYKPMVSSFSSGSSNTAKEAVPFKKDQFIPSPEVQALARGPANNIAEGLTVDYHGEKIGVDKDNLFNMVNRRYNLKSQQNIFIGE